MSTITLPSDFKYVIASLGLLPLLNQYIDISVIKARKAAKVALPALFASEEEAKADIAKHRFNCAQKASMNFSEHVGGFVAAVLVSGFFFPKISAGLAATWIFGRVFYHQGYSTGDPKKRMRGGIASVALLSLTVLSLVGTYKALVL